MADRDFNDWYGIFTTADGTANVKQSIIAGN